MNGLFDAEKYMHAPSLIFIALSYMLIAIAFAIIYRRQEDSPKVWKASVVLVLGMIAFNFSFNLSDEVVSVPIVPLGVALLSWLLRRKGNEGRWQRFRRFAWLGFLSNFIFLTASLLAMPLDGIIYPKSETTTYMMDVNKASLIATHSNSKEVTLNKEELQRQMNKMKQKKIESESWYYGINEESGYKETFPYILTGSVPKKGSGLETLIFIEEDGKGLLITPNKGHQVYFRLEESILTGGVLEE
ncbi:hypothetical protein [Peribacillus sp. ACCC06369]|uniref:hypothetical protein n=1 Tax=Peribacillus sp. ACCC06369 TaxID=3055860 RepID=UPI0025A1119F|nr:hypothetical protein [Peribacillus sp. ACCC06369]MDM5357396.1 hypothetical protein [Peribacillus sp. ACCC06369]